MSVLLETSLGDIVIDLLCDKAPFACKNFIKLCKIKYYNGALFYDVQKSYLTRVMHEKKEPTSLNHVLYGEQAKYFEDQVDPERRHDKFGTVSTSNVGPNMNNSNFFITLSDGNIESLNGKHTIFGLIAEGTDVLRKVNESYVDDDNRPYKNIRILHTLVLEDPFDDPPNLDIPEASPEINYDDTDRLDVNDKIDLIEGNGRTEEEIIEDTKRHEAKTKAIVLEMLNDLPDAEIKPPDNILFVCKLNPLTEEDDLETIFSQFGPIKSCEVIRDWKTGASLQYAFIEFETEAACEEAFFKMENALIDERRIHVDFSQSVSKYWYKYKSGNPIAYGGGGKGDGGPGKKHRNQPKLELKGRHREDKGGYGIVIDEEEATHEARRTKHREPEPRKDKDNDKQREQREKDRDRERDRPAVKPREGSRERREDKRGDKRDDRREEKRDEKRDDRRDDRKQHHDSRNKGRRDRSKSRSRSPRREKKHESSRGRDKERDSRRDEKRHHDERHRSRDRKDDKHRSGKREEERRKDDRRKEKVEDKKKKKVSSSRSSSSSSSSGSASSSRSSS